MIVLWVKNMKMYVYLCIRKFWKDKICNKSMRLKDRIKIVFVLLSYFYGIFGGCRDCWI